jgi:ABC-type transport system involved in multi-copper enzyme maturation permease subunit
MPVYDYTYQTFEGTRRGALARWVTIPRFTYMEFFAKRQFIVLFTLSWLHLLLCLAYIYIRVNAELIKSTLNIDISLDRLPAVDAFFFKYMIDVQMVFCFIFTLSIGPDLISRDLRHSAIVLYMSKPISRWEYFLGKFLTLFGLLMVITWFQTMFLYVAQYLMSPSNSDWRLYFLKSYAWLVWPILAYSTVIAGTLSLLILTCSSLAKNARYAGLMFGGYIVGTTMVLGPVMEETHIDNGMAISPFLSGMRLGYSLFHLSNKDLPLSYTAAWMGILAVWALCAIVLYWRLRNAARYGR